VPHAGTECPHLFMLIIINYSDSMLVPHLADEPKSWGHLHHLPLQICGILNHGKQLGQPHTHWPVYSKDPNTTSTRSCSSLAIAPLYLQMVNKNACTLGFLSQLTYTRQ
jgi:hypothetical protein